MCACPRANAGTHSRRWLSLGEWLPQVASTFRIMTTEGMGPGIRRDDIECFVDALRKFPNSNFKQPSARVPAPPRELGC